MPNRNGTPLTLFLGLALLALAMPQAWASTPSAGEVSAGHSALKWTGELENSLLAQYTVMNSVAGSNEAVPCAAPTCDTFTLTVVEAGDLSITGSVPEATAGTSEKQYVVMRVKKPDGTFVIEQGEADDKTPFAFTIMKAQPGSYVIDYWNSFVGPSSYTGTARLTVPAPPVDPVPLPTAQPAAVSQQAAAPAPGISIGRVSGRARGRTLTVGFAVGSPVRWVRATLSRGSRKVAAAQVGAVASSGSLKLKSKKRLKPGTYRLVVTALPEAGAVVTSEQEVTIRK